MPLTYISICSGIEAASVAWHKLKFIPLAFSEIDTFPSQVLSHHYPHVENVGDFTKCDWTKYPSPDILVAGTPCQAFSVAGKGLSLADPRGNLTLEFINVANTLNPKFIAWENVPGVLSKSDNPFGCLLAGLAGFDQPALSPKGKWPPCGYLPGPERNVAWRTLDAQYFGLAQRRKRVFLVASPRGGTNPLQILFEPHGLQRNSPPSRSQKEETSPNFAELFNAEGSVGATLTASNIGKHLNNQTPLVVHGTQDPCTSDIAFSLQRNGGQENVLLNNFVVRRLTPIECERLQGFPDNYTLISPNTKDTPRYKAIGNSMAVPVMKWIGERILNAR